MIRSTVKYYAKRALGRPAMPPPVHGVADASWYDAAYSALDGYRNPFWQSHYYSLWCVMADRIRRDHLRHVLDIGCGPGQFAACLFALADIESYVGLDFSSKAVDLARKMCPQGVFEVGDATTTAIPHTLPHDVVICTEVLEHVPNDYDVLRRFRPGVRALCTVPNFPYDSHVRHFRTADEVRDRYDRFFEAFDVFPIIGHWAPKNVYYLMDGIRNETASDGCG